MATYGVSSTDQHKTEHKFSVNMCYWALLVVDLV